MPAWHTAKLDDTKQLVSKHFQNTVQSERFRQKLRNGNKRLAAKYLGIAQQTLARHLKEAEVRHEATG